MDATGIAAQVGRRVQKPHRKRDFAHGPVVCEIGGFGPFWLGIAHLPILWQPPAHRGARRRIGVRRRCHPPIAHASHVHQILTDCSQVNS